MVFQQDGDGTLVVPRLQDFSDLVQRLDGEAKGLEQVLARVAQNRLSLGLGLAPVRTPGDSVSEFMGSQKPLVTQTGQSIFF